MGWQRTIREVGVMLGTAALITACATSSSAGNGPQSAASVGATPQTPSGTAPPGPLVGSGEPVSTTTGKLTVTMSSAIYAHGAVVSAVIANGLAQTIYTTDSKSDCAIAFLQRRDGGAWVDVTGCALGRAPLTVPIGPGLGRTVSFDPSSIHFRSSLGGPAFDRGTYRVKFTYRSTAGEDAQEPLVAHSAGFEIQ